MAGIIASALAGGLEGGGLAVASQGKQWTEKLHQDALNEAQALRARSLAELQEGFAAKREARQETAAQTRLEAGFGHTETMARIRRDFEIEQNEAQRTLSREQIAAQKEIARFNRDNALAIARIGGTIQQDKDGNVLFITKDGKANPILDPRTNQPMVGYKDLTPAAKAYSDVIHGQLKNLDTLEASPMTDNATKENLNKRRTDLNTELLNVLTGGIGVAGQGRPQPTVPQAAIDALKKDPSLAEQFKAKYKVDPAQYLSSGQTPAPRAVTAAQRGPAPAAAPAIPETPEAQGFDAARQRFEQAERTLKSYGLSKRRTDPDGFEKAKRERDEAQRAFNQAMSQHETALGEKTQPYFGR